MSDIPVEQAPPAEAPAPVAAPTPDVTPEPAAAESSASNFDWGGWNGESDSLPDDYRDIGGKISDWHKSTNNDTKEELSTLRSMYSAMLDGDEDPRINQYFEELQKIKKEFGEKNTAFSDLEKNYDVPAKEWIGRSEEIPDRVSALKAPREEIKPYTGGVPRTKRGQYLFNQGQSQESLVPPHKPRGGWPLRGGPVPPSPEDRELAEIQRRFMAGGTTPEERANLEGQAYDYYKRKYPYLTDEELNKFISEPNT